MEKTKFEVISPPVNGQTERVTVNPPSGTTTLFTATVPFGAARKYLTSRPPREPRRPSQHGKASE